MSLIKKPHEIAVKVTIKALIYGPPGSWKTTTALSAPRPLHIDTDDGVHRVAPYHQKDVIQVRSWENVSAILDPKQVDLSEYDTLVIDTGGKMLTYMSEFVGRMNPTKNRQGDGSLTQKGFGVRKQMFIDFLKKVSDLGKHILFVAHDKEDRKGEGVYVRPDLGGSSGQDLIRELDLVAYIRPIGAIKTISFEATDEQYGKNTIGLPPVLELPVSTGPKNDFLTGIFKDFEQQAEARQKLGIAYNKLVDDVKTRVAAIKTPEQANELYKWLKEYDGHIWNSMLDCRRLVFDRCNELGFIANPDTKLFELPAPATPAATDDGKGGGKGNDKADKKNGGKGPENANNKAGQDPLKNEDENSKLV